MTAWHLLVSDPIFEIALFASVGYFLIGLDEIAIDLLWLARSAYQFLDARRGELPLSVDHLPESPGNPWFAVLIPAFDEADVIGKMLDRALAQYAGRNVHVFVGGYSCDPPTIRIVRQYEGEALSLVVLERAGSTTKADCLNTLYRAIPEYERRFARRFAGFILHDAEDVVDGHEVSVFAAFVERYAMIQLPVIPLPNRQSRWVGGHYCDEFAEAHSKTMVVRHMLGAGLPSAGVGCMIRRDAIEAMAAHSKGDPFDENCATEDYECGLRLAAMGFDTSFLRVRAPNAFGLVATTAYFPSELGPALTQKTRWISGIALAGWDRIGWGRGRAENWMRMRDRIPVISALVSVAGYAATILAVPLIATAWLGGMRLIPFGEGLVTLATMNGLILLWRLSFRAWFVARLYGLKEGLFSVPRIAVSNVIGILSVRRAIPKHLKETRTGAVEWEKTAHIFPDSLS